MTEPPPDRQSVVQTLDCCKSIVYLLRLPLQINGTFVWASGKCCRLSNVNRATSAPYGVPRFSEETSTYKINPIQARNGSCLA